MQCKYCNTTLLQSKFNQQHLYCPDCKKRYWSDSGKEVTRIVRKTQENQTSSTTSTSTTSKVNVSIKSDNQKEEAKKIFATEVLYRLDEIDKTTKEILEDIKIILRKLFLK